MSETNQEVIHNRSEDEENNETEKKRPENLGGNEMKSIPASSTGGEIGMEALIFRDIMEGHRSGGPYKLEWYERTDTDTDRKVIVYRDPDKEKNEMDKSEIVAAGSGVGVGGIIKKTRVNKQQFEKKDAYGGPSKVATTHGPRRARHFDCAVYGAPVKVDLSNPDVQTYAAEAVKEYNNRGFKDKLELVKVRRATATLVAGRLFTLTFDVKVVADGEEGERIQTYQAEVWRKIDQTLEVVTFKHVSGAQGRGGEWIWDRN